MLEFEAGPEKERLDEFLAHRLPRTSLTRIRALISSGEVLINGERTAKGTRLQLGDQIVVSDTNDLPTSATPEPIPIDILYEDDEVIGVNKPSGLLTHPSNREKSGTLTNALAHHFLQSAGRHIRAGLIHRLDRDTSGVIVIAKTPRAHRIISKAFRERRVSKTYLAFVCGKVLPDAGEIEAPIGCDPDAWPHWRIMEGGRPAFTRYRVRRRFPAYTLLELEPQTGRTHQIRIHCTSIGHPLFGDQIYGRRDDEEAKRLGVKHHLLHAQRLIFRHPSYDREVDLQAPLPPQILEMILNAS
jgi:23S rRNA pseudouridine1911/1915/1917 synthase